MNQTKQLPSKPIGVIASLASGLDTVIQGWWILLFPLLLDLFLWFGPRLSILPVAQEVANDLVTVFGSTRLGEVVVEATEKLNYFSIVSVAPLGIPSLMSVKLPQDNPLNTPGVFSITSQMAWLGAFLLLSLLGLLIGGIYMGLIAQQVRDGRLSLARLLEILPRYWLSLLVLLIALLALAAVASIPIMLLVGALAAISTGVATIVIWLGIMALLWVVFHLVFTIHGILLSEETLIKAAWNSIRLTAFNSFPTMGLLALTLGISAGLDYLWGLPGEDSWMLLVGIAGHAVISSGLIAATFVFYQDRYRYWTELQNYFKRTTKEPLENAT